MGVDYLGYMDHFGLPRSGIIHVGANNAGEARFYAQYGSMPVAYFEPVPATYEKALAATKRFPQMRVFHACCADEDGRLVTFNVSSNRGMSSSMFPLGRHGQIAPGVSYVEKFEITTSRVDTLLRPHYRLDDFNLAVIDTQGADLMVLKGLGDFLNYIDAVNIEVSDTPLYESGATFDQIYRYMDGCGFNIAMMSTTNTDWGNAFFKRRQPVYRRDSVNAISRGKPATMSSQHGDHPASLGNDGDIESRHKYFHTKKEKESWWKVDLLEETPIKAIYLYDRAGQGERSKSLVVEVSRDDQNYTQVHDRAGEIKTGRTATGIRWKGKARYVRVRLLAEDYLHLRQVAVVADEFAKPVVTDPEPQVVAPEKLRAVRKADAKSPPAPTAKTAAPRGRVPSRE